MHLFNLFCVSLLQIILFVLPTVSAQEERVRGFFNWDDLFGRGGSFRYFDTYTTPGQSTKHCPEIKYTFDSMPFLIVPCFDKSSKELEVTLKVGDVDLGQAKGAYDSELSISFDYGQLLKGEHRYYLKENYLWLRYDNIIFGKEQKGDKKLVSVPSGFIPSEPKSNPKPEVDTSDSKPKKNSNGSKRKPKKDASKEGVPKPNPERDAPKSRYEL